MTDFHSDPNTGKVHRERNRGTQHYLLCSWRGVDYRLTGRFAYWGPSIASEYKDEDGNLLWGDEEGNWYPGKVPSEHMIWEETINWRTDVPKLAVRHPDFIDEDAS